MANNEPIFSILTGKNFESSAYLLTPSSSNTFTAPAGAKMIKAWVIGAGGSYSYNCDGGGNGNGEQSTAGIVKGFINEPMSFSTSIGASVPSVCDLEGVASSTTLTIANGSLNPLYNGPFVSNGGIHRGRKAAYDTRIVGSKPAAVSGVITQQFLWDLALSTRQYPAKFFNALTLAGTDPSTHRLGMGGISNATQQGGDGGVLLLFTDYETVTFALFGNSTLNIPNAYSSAKVWAVGGGGVGQIYCDGGSNTYGGDAAVAVKTFSNVAGQTLSYSVAPAITDYCDNPQNGGSTTATIDGVSITAGGGLSNGSNGSASGDFDSSGIANEDVSGLLDAYDDAEVFTDIIIRSFTVTVANPAYFSSNGHALKVGDRITFSTTGSLPTGIDASTTYYIISSGLTSNNFRVSTTPGGSAVVTSGSQSGNHTLRVIRKEYGLNAGSSSPKGGVLFIQLNL
jgi:hypothetical protein